MRKLFFGALTVLTLISLSTFRPQGVAASSCGGPYPPKPEGIQVMAGPGGGEATLYWEEVPYANRYAVVYGTAAGEYIYGATDIGGGQARSYTVKSLTPGAKYYFRLSASRDCTSSPFSEEVTTWAGSGPVTADYSGEVSTSSASSESTMPKAQIIQGSDLSAAGGPGAGQVTLRWNHKEDVDTYHLVYGNTAGDYLYGATNIGKITEFTVSALVPGRSYYFALVPVKGDRALYTGNPVRGQAGGAVGEVYTSSDNLLGANEEPVVMTEPEQGIGGAPVSEDGLIIGADRDADTDVQGVDDENYTYEEPADDPNTFNIPQEIENEGYVSPQD